MTCEHLIELEKAIIAAGFQETFRGAAWSTNCREWVYFDCVLATDLIQQASGFAHCVKIHSHRGTHDGQEAGFVCDIHHDGIMGHHPDARPDAKTYRP